MAKKEYKVPYWSQKAHIIDEYEVSKKTFHTAKLFTHPAKMKHGIKIVPEILYWEDRKDIEPMLSFYTIENGIQTKVAQFARKEILDEIESTSVGSYWDILEGTTLVYVHASKKWFLNNDQVAGEMEEAHQEFNDELEKFLGWSDVFESEISWEDLM